MGFSGWDLGCFGAAGRAPGAETTQAAKEEMSKRNRKGGLLMSRGFACMLDWAPLASLMLTKARREPQFLELEL